MTESYSPPKKPIALSDEDQAAFRDLAQEITWRVRAIKSVSRRSGWA